MADLNTVALTGNLTADAELRGADENVLAVRLAVTGRTKVGETWQDVPNYFDVTVFGKAGEGNRAKALAPYLTLGTRIAVQGRLEWRQWEADDGSKRQAVQVIADDLVLLGSGKRDADAVSSGQS
jgi:single-strand DNA-binding protein